MKTLVSGLEREILPSEWSDLEEFLMEFVRGLPPSLVRFFQAHVAGQLAAFRHKSMRQLAARIGVTDVYFWRLLRDPRWDDEKLRSRLSSYIQRVHGNRLRGILFEQSFWSTRKAGFRRGGKASQASRGRRIPFSLTHLVLAERDFCCLLDSDPWLPPAFTKKTHRHESGASARRDRENFRWQGALELVNRTKRSGFRFDWLLLGPSYGVEIEFLQALSENGQRFIAEIPGDVAGWLYHPLVVCALPGQTWDLFGNGRPELPRRPPRSVRELTAALLPEEEAPRTGAGVIVLDSPWYAWVLPFYAQHRGHPTDPLGLLILRHRTSGQSRYFLGNGFLGESLTSATKIALSKDIVERASRSAVGAVGLGASRVRDFASFKRHLALSTLAILYRAERPHKSAGNSSSPKGSA